MIEKIIEYANEIHEALGPGYSERIYHNAMEVKLRQNGICYDTERIIPIEFDGHTIGNMRADLIVDHQYVVELKATRIVNDQMIQQGRNYMKLLGLKSGLVINFSKTCEVSILSE